MRRERLMTERLEMHALEEKDGESLIRMAKDDRIGRTYMMPELASAEQESRFFQRMKALSADGARLVLGIYLRGELIGFLNDCGMDGKRAELGYFIAPEHWGRGYAAEALRAAVEELFRLGYEEIVAGYFEENPASRRVMEKCGMRPLAQETVIEYRGGKHRCLYCGIRREALYGA